MRQVCCSSKQGTSDDLLLQNANVGEDVYVTGEGFFLAWLLLSQLAQIYYFN